MELTLSTFVMARVAPATRRMAFAPPRLFRYIVMPTVRRRIIEKAGLKGYDRNTVRDDAMMDQTKHDINACFRNARDLLRAAKRLLEVEKLPNIGFHLAVLALEEVGKR